MTGQGRIADVGPVAAESADKKHFFISYNRADQKWAEWIAWQLEEGGYSTVIQAWDFRPGSNFVLDMQRAAERAERTIAVLSPDYLASRFTAPEWSAAFARDPTGTLGLLVPVRVRECDPAGLIPQITYIDLSDTDDKVLLRSRLLEGVRRGRVKPTVEPPLPRRLRDVRDAALRAPANLARAAVTVAHDKGARLRIARVAAMALLIGVGLHWFLRSTVPNLMDGVNALSVVGLPALAAALGIEWLVRLLTGRASGIGSGETTPGDEP